MRRVIVEVGDLSTGLPCEVVYWKDTEAPGERRVLWNARSDALFCDDKAAGLVDKLANAGWNCDSGDAPVQADAPVQVNTPPEPIATPAPDQATRPADVAAAVPDVDAATAPVQPPAAPVQPPVSQSAVTPPPFDATDEPAPSAAAGGTGTQDLQTAAIAPEPAATGSLDQLQSVIDANLTSLNQTVDGDFKADIGDFGDLNNDGNDDAVVFFNYKSSTADFTQFVAAYLFNGKSYHLAATKPVGGTDLAVREVEVENIVDGSIQLRLVLNDAEQTENRRAAMVLKDGQLVEIQ